MAQIKPIYYSQKMNKYYFNGTSVFGDYKAITVYGGDNLKGGEIRIDKNGRKYIMGYVEIVKGKKGTYYKCTGFVPATEKAETAEEVAETAINEEVLDFTE